MSTSCGHTWARTHPQTHCGVCSQCIDRRFAVLAANQADNDPEAGYAVDLLTGNRTSGEPRTMLAAYLDLVERVEQMGEVDFYSHFGEVARALPHLGLPTRVGATRVFDLYQRHARDVSGVVTRAIAANALAVRRRDLPRNCLLRMVYEEGAAAEEEPSPSRRPEGNYFVRRGRFWAIRFGEGEEEIYPADQGFDYLRLLLASPGTTFSAARLAAAVRRGANPGVPAATGRTDSAPGVTPVGRDRGDDVLDLEASTEMQARLSEIDEQIAGLSESRESPGVIDAIDELEHERRQIADELGRARGLRGRPRKLGDEKDRVRNRVCVAIRRAIKHIRDQDPALAEHLGRPVLNLGHTVSYAPRSDVTWELDDPTGAEKPGLHEM